MLTCCESRALFCALLPQPSMCPEAMTLCFGTSQTADTTREYLGLLLKSYTTPTYHELTVLYCAPITVSAMTVCFGGHASNTIEWTGGYSLVSTRPILTCCLKGKNAPTTHVCLPSAMYLFQVVHLWSAYVSSVVGWWANAVSSLPSPSAPSPSLVSWAWACAVSIGRSSGWPGKASVRMRQAPRSIDQRLRSARLGSYSSPSHVWRSYGSELRDDTESGAGLLSLCVTLGAPKSSKRLEGEEWQ